MADIYNTQYFNVETDPEMRVKKVLELVYVAMTEKGYNPVNQIVGYIISGDPTYITSHKNARSMIMKVERDEIVEELLKEYSVEETFMTESDNGQQSLTDRKYSRVLGLDFGSKTVGVAVSDPLRLTAQGVEIIRRKSENKLRQTLARISELASDYQAEAIVLGFPRNMNATIGERAKATIEFKAMVERRTSLPVILWDERLTTVAADQVMDETGVRDHKKYVDEIAAMLILQGYLDRTNAGLPVPEVNIDEE